MAVKITTLTRGMTVAELAETLEFLDEHRAWRAAQAGMSAAAMGFDPSNGIAVYRDGQVYTPWEIEARARVKEDNAKRRPVMSLIVEMPDDLF